MDEQKNKSEKKSWWGYGIAAVYTVFALSTLGIVAFTMTQRVDLVAKDYYSKEIKYDEQFNRELETKAMAEPLRCQVSEDGKEIELIFPAALRQAKGKIVLYRPSEAAQDREYEVQPNGEGVQLIPTAKLMPGFWRAKVTWTADGREFYHEFLLQLR